MAAEFFSLYSLLEIGLTQCRLNQEWFDKLLLDIGLEVDFIDKMFLE